MPTQSSCAGYPYLLHRVPPLTPRHTSSSKDLSSLNTIRLKLALASAAGFFPISPPSIHVLSEPQNGTLFENRVLADVIKRCSPGLEQVLNSMTGVLMRRGEDTHYKRKQCDDGIRDWNRAATSQGMPRITCSHQKLRETRNDSSLEPSEGPQPCRHFDIRLLALRTVREQFFIVFGHLKTYPLFGTLL